MFIESMVQKGGVINTDILILFRIEIINIRTCFHHRFLLNVAVRCKYAKEGLYQVHIEPKSRGNLPGPACGPIQSMSRLENYCLHANMVFKLTESI